jgi:hypothetical protein
MSLIVTESRRQSDFITAEAAPRNCKNLNDFGLSNCASPNNRGKINKFNQQIECGAVPVQLC